MQNKDFLPKVLLISLSLFMLAAARTANAQENKKFIVYYVDHGEIDEAPAQDWQVYYKGINDAAAMLAPLGVEVKHLSAGRTDRDY